ncbi:putative N-alpha-acetyltransferase 30 [Monocercomonoides exilis]|uniref:putative N-alpha-acetyltransferase 30 n=1 Tax=Monocercomonoides exilis TaxID=2049356 RepID=UPI00355968BD|nr:putative N-alpha-acetyltransferase 30 [Monocercomonoides exilis]|eukprot:MONOS_11216.1-p1 / transcript=MONOS_11216.1 / gene=MONOS_11216 / organism=Monocercomonoides_exilis_PA203 / gene_product=N-acetyltransferase 12 / transcript_product=N-acetyltransferase 12 / location=Mono_scaffold00551:23180-23910(+) / protein_length=160 / sequence_SO=supercontig / SO=protein_coding / is_pseudo=false
MDNEKKDILQKLEYSPYSKEEDIRGIMKLMEKALSEPYSIFSHRYFFTENKDLSLTVKYNGQLIAACENRLKIRGQKISGNIGMVAVLDEFRGLGIGKELVSRSIELMRGKGASEIFLETEVKNESALSLYESLGFVRHKFLYKYYSTGEDAFRLKLFLS